MNANSVRALPLSVDERQASIIDATIPLLLARGREVTSREIADAAGVAEGTVFRAFGDKESLLRAAATRYFDFELLRRGLRGIDPDDPLDVKLRTMIELFQSRLRGVFRMVSILPEVERPQAPAGEDGYAEIIAAILEPDLDRLTMTPEKVAHVIRLIGVATALPRVNDGTQFTIDELTSIIMHGVVAEDATSTTTKKKGN